MNWVVWKQHRQVFVILGVVLALYAGITVPMGLHLWHLYERALTACTRASDCSQLSSELFKTGWSHILNPNANAGEFDLVGVLCLAVPFLLGMFIGVPLIAREYANKTNLLMWTQSVSRRTWLTMKLIGVLTATTVFAAGFSLLTTWWSRAGNALYADRFSPLLFDIQGFAAIGYAVLAVSIGIALGALLKRTMTAVGLTLVLMVAIQIAIGGLVRPHYMAPFTETVVTNQFALNFHDVTGQGRSTVGAWITSAPIVNDQGQTLDWANPPVQCVVQRKAPSGPAAEGGNPGPTIAVNGGPLVSGDCLESEGYHYMAEYQPAYRYWDFQRLETGLYVALSLIPLSATYWLVLKRDV